VVVLLAGAARRLLGVAIALPRGSAKSRESLTQDSRSAVKARLIDPLRESFGEGRCAPRGDERGGLARGHHVNPSLGHAEYRRLHSATTVLRAYVTGSDDAREALCVHATASRRVVRASSMARHTSGAKAIARAPPVGGDLWMLLG